MEDRNFHFKRLERSKLKKYLENEWWFDRYLAYFINLIRKLGKTEGPNFRNNLKRTTSISRND